MVISSTQELEMPYLIALEILILTNLCLLELFRFAGTER